MSRKLLCLALVAVLAVLPLPAHAQAQAQDEYDSFGIQDDGKTLDQVAPDDGGMAPATPALQPESPQQPDTGAAPAPTSPAAPGPDAPASVAPATPGPATTAAAVPPAGETVAVVAPPAGWQQMSLATISAWVPADFAKAGSNGDNGLTYFQGDQTTPKGLAFGLNMVREQEMIPPEAKVSVDKQVSLDGQMFRWREFAAQMDATHRIEAIAVSSQQPMDGDRFLMLGALAIGVPLEDKRVLIQTILGTVHVGAIASPTAKGEALGGWVTYEIPKDWHTLEGREGKQMGFWPLIYSGYISFARGDAVTGDGGTDGLVPAGTPSKPTEIFGQPADLFSWSSSDPEFQDVATMKPGRKDYYRLKGCVGGEAVSVMIGGLPSFIDSADFRAALAKFALTLPDGLAPCPAATAGEKAPPAQEVVVPPTQQAATPPAQETANPPAQQGPVPSAQGAAPGGTPIDVEGVRFLLPEGWTVQHDEPGDKQFVSADGLWTLLAFWWLPDEPLLGFDDITGHETVTIDGESVTRIHIRNEQRLTIQNVTDRARADQKRFIFTLDGDGVSAADDLQTKLDGLVAGLKLQAGFGTAEAGTANQPEAPAVSADGWATYVNARYGTRIDYPARLFHALPEPDNGDGLTFESADGTARLAVFGQQNIDDLDGPAMLARDVDFGQYDKVTYKASGKGWYVLSGLSGGKIYYRRAVIDPSAGVVHVFELSYPPSARARFDPVVARMAKSFGHR